MNSQKHLFQLPHEIHYINCGYMSPLLRSVEEAGIIGLQRKRDPSKISANDFFNDGVRVRELFAQLIHGNSKQVAVIPSASYGLQNAVNNVPLNNGSHALTIGDEFPSDYYAVSKWCALNHKEFKVINSGNEVQKRGEKWNEKLLNEINNETALVVLSSVHWMDGTLFDLQSIGKRCKEVNAVFIVDGTQSVGALPIDVSKYQIDALVCAGYKWLLGPYSIGAAYYSEEFDHGEPIEDSWLNRTNAEDFSALTQYSDEYTAGAGRYNMGEYSNFILVPMFIRSLEQILSWKENAVQDYCGQIIIPLINFLKENKAFVEEDNWRANHLFGFKLPTHIESKLLLNELQKRKVFVSVRGDSIRVSPHLYNDERDIEALTDALKKIL